MDWANGIKSGQSVLVNGETGLNRVWNAPDLGFRPVMTGRPKGTYSPSPFGGKPGTADVGEEKKEDGSSKKGKNKKKGWRYGKMTAEFDPEIIEQQVNETVEDFGVDLVDRNETVEEEPAKNGTTQSVPASELDLGWSKEDKKIWVKYGLSPAYLREMRKIEDRLLGEHVCSTVDILEGKPLGACTEFAICLLYTSPSPRD